MTPEEMWHMIIAERDRYPNTSHIWLVLNELAAKCNAKIKR